LSTYPFLFRSYSSLSCAASEEHFAERLFVSLADQSSVLDIADDLIRILRCQVE